MTTSPHSDQTTAPHPVGATGRLKAILDRMAADAAGTAAPPPHTPAQPERTDNDPSTGHGTVGAEETATMTASDPPGSRPNSGSGPKATLGALIEALDERAYGLLLLLFALPCCLPFLYGIPQIVALPMLALAGQLALGREAPWLPGALAKRQFDILSMRHTVEKAERYAGWLERLSHTRLRALSDGTGGRIVGALLLIPCASILVPLPLTNTTPGIGVAITALGLIERDGLLIILGLALGIAWVFILLFLGAEAVSLAKDWLLGLF